MLDAQLTDEIQLAKIDRLVNQARKQLNEQIWPVRCDCKRQYIVKSNMVIVECAHATIKVLNINSKSDMLFNTLIKR